MQKLFAGLGGGSGLTAAGVIGALLLGAAVWVQNGRMQAEDELAAVPGVAAPEGTSQEVTDQTVQADDPVDPAPEALPPAFDEVRRESDGVTVIAGTAVPGAEVSILKNGTPIAGVTADGTGKFATLTMIPPDGEGHVLTLLQTVQGEAPVSSSDEIILAPITVAESVEILSDVETLDVVETGVSEQQPDASVVVADADQITDGAEASAPVVMTEAASETVPVTIEDTVPQDDQKTGVQTTSSEMAEPVQTASSENVDPGSAEPQIKLVETDDAAAPPVAVDAAELPGSAETETPRVEVALLDQTVQLESAPRVKPRTQQMPQTSATRPEVTESAATPEPAITAPVLRSTQGGVELLGTRAPDVMESVEIDTISYSEVGDVQLSGRAQEGAAQVRVYLNNDSVVSLPVDSEGRWRGNLPDVDEGVYTLRVDELASDGTVSSRVETPFKREAPAVLAAAAAESTGPISAITVQKGATLWAIARERYGEGELYVRVFEANREFIRDPDLIYPGQVFALPD